MQHALYLPGPRLTGSVGTGRGGGGDGESLVGCSVRGGLVGGTGRVGGAELLGMRE